MKERRLRETAIVQLEQSLFDLRHRRYMPNECVELCLALNAEIRYATSEELNKLDLPTMAAMSGAATSRPRLLRGSVWRVLPLWYARGARARQKLPEQCRAGVKNAGALRCATKMK